MGTFDVFSVLVMSEVWKKEERTEERKKENK